MLWLSCQISNHLLGIKDHLVTCANDLFIFKELTAMIFSLCTLHDLCNITELLKGHLSNLNVNLGQ